MIPPSELRRFMDDEGRLRQWPARRKLQLVAIDWLAARFEAGRTYAESEVNALLNAAHTFGDWALLRRELCDGRWLERRSDGSAYWRSASAPRRDVAIDRTGDTGSIGSTPI